MFRSEAKEIIDKAFEFMERDQIKREKREKSRNAIDNHSNDDQGGFDLSER